MVAFETVAVIVDCVLPTHGEVAFAVKVKVIVPV
jgi:hypothetical protein